VAASKTQRQNTRCLPGEKVSLGQPQLSARFFSRRWLLPGGVSQSHDQLGGFHRLKKILMVPARLSLI
jgi:hypothetical protein